MYDRLSLLCSARNRKTNSAITWANCVLLTSIRVLWYEVPKQRLQFTSRSASWTTRSVRLQDSSGYVIDLTVPISWWDLSTERVDRNELRRKVNRSKPWYSHHEMGTEFYFLRSSVRSTPSVVRRACTTIILTGQRVEFEKRESRPQQKPPCKSATRVLNAIFWSQNFARNKIASVQQVKIELHTCKEGLSSGRQLGCHYYVLSGHLAHFTWLAFEAQIGYDQNLAVPKESYEQRLFSRPFCFRHLS